MNPLLLILTISIAGPVIGSFVGVIKKPSENFIHNLLAFVAGVMLSISFLQLIPQSIGLSSVWLCVLGVAIGSIFMFIVDKFIPHIHPELCKQEQGRNLQRTAKYLLVGIFLHNFPEGLAMGVGAVTDYKISLLIAIAIAFHDIPEGICTSAPYYYVTGKKLKSFLISSSTAIATILGFVFAHYLFPKIPLQVVATTIAATAGLMIYISADELIPVSCSKDSEHWSHTTIFSLIMGVLFVVVLGGDFKDNYQLSNKSLSKFIY